MPLVTFVQQVAGQAVRTPAFYCSDQSSNLTKV